MRNFSKISIRAPIAFTKYYSLTSIDKKNENDFLFCRISPEGRISYSQVNRFPCGGFLLQITIKQRLIHYSKCNLLSCWSVGPSVCHNFLKWREVTLTCSYNRTRYYFLYYYSVRASIFPSYCKQFFCHTRQKKHWSS